MLHKVKMLKRYKLDSLDGEIGKAIEFYFDDKHWAVRYLVADAGNWLSDRQVLISPQAISSVNKEEEQIEINLTKKQIEDCPPLESDLPVSRQYEEEFYRYFGWPVYWAGPNMWGIYPYIMNIYEIDAVLPETPKTGDPDLRSTNDVNGHQIQAEDGMIGHVEDFIIDDNNWSIRYLIIETRNWLPGKKVLISPEWIERVSWGESKVFVKLCCETIRQSPEYTEESLLTRDYETILHRHYNQEGSWEEDSVNRDHLQ